MIELLLFLAFIALVLFGDNLFAAWQDHLDSQIDREERRLELEERRQALLERQLKN